VDLASTDHLLTTTRSVRKRVDLNRPVEPEVIERCIEIAFQAPTGSNMQGWHFVVVTDARKRAHIGDLYRKAFEVYANAPEEVRPRIRENDPRFAQQERVIASATYLARRMHEVPVMVIPCVEGRVENSGPLAQASLYGSIIPAAWSLMLALRSRGLGSSWTTLHIMFEREAAQVLGIPDSVTQAALLPVAYFKGEDFKPAERLPARDHTHWNAWGQRRVSKT
jgi:nitroreductase